MEHVFDLTFIAESNQADSKHFQANKSEQRSKRHILHRSYGTKEETKDLPPIQADTEMDCGSINDE